MLPKPPGSEVEPPEPVGPTTQPPAVGVGVLALIIIVIPERKEQRMFSWCTQNPAKGTSCDQEGSQDWERDLKMSMVGSNGTVSPADQWWPHPVALVGLGQGGGEDVY